MLVADKRVPKVVKSVHGAFIHDSFTVFPKIQFDPSFQASLRQRSVTGRTSDSAFTTLCSNGTTHFTWMTKPTTSPRKILLEYVHIYVALCLRKYCTYICRYGGPGGRMCAGVGRRRRGVSGPNYCSAFVIIVLLRGLRTLMIYSLWFYQCVEYSIA